MAPIYVAIVDNLGNPVCDYDVVAGVDPTHSVRALKETVKAWAAELARIEPRQMTVYGPWATQPRVTDVTELLKAEPLPVTALLSTLGDASGDRFFLVRITVPIVAPAAAGGAGV